MSERGVIRVIATCEACDAVAECTLDADCDTGMEIVAPEGWDIAVGYQSWAGRSYQSVHCPLHAKVTT